MTTETPKGWGDRMPLIKTADQITADVAATGGEPTPDTDQLWPAVDVTVEAALTHASVKVRKAGERAKAAVQAIHREIAEWDAAAEQRVAQDRARAAAKAEVEAAERALTAAREKARAVGASGGGSRTKRGTSGRTISPEGRANLRLGALKTSHGKGHHDGCPHAECPRCAAA